MIGRTVSHYRILEKLGSGGMGEVYKGEDIRLNRFVALKFLNPGREGTPEDLQRFVMEARTASSLNHPNICTVYDAGLHEERPYIVMEYLQGATLRDLLQSGPLSAGNSVDYGIQIARGLGAAHAKGILHRDLKPANVYVTEEGFAKVLDFGLSKLLQLSTSADTNQSGFATTEEPLSQPGSLIGTAPYMSPEQVRGETLDARSDLFSLGIVLYEMATGVRPFVGATAGAVYGEILTGEPVSPREHNSELPEGLGRILQKALEKEREDRYQSAGDLRNDLEQLRPELDLRTSAGRRWGAGMRGVLRRMRARGLRIGTALLAVLVLLVVATPWGQQMFDFLRRGTAPVSEQHIAVLPFSCVGEGVEKQAFCTGLVEILTSKLSQLEQFHGTLWVVPASEIRRENLASVREARRAFGINLGVTGSVQFMGEEIRLTVNLVEAATLRQLDSEVLSYRPDRLTELQDRTVRSLLQMLAVGLQPGSLTVLAAGGTEVPRAYDFYVQGIGYLQRPDLEENLETAISLLKRSIEEDPTHAEAVASLGLAYWKKYELTKEDGWVREAIDTSRKAFRLAPGLPGPHVSLGTIYIGTGRYEDALREFERALALDPKNAGALLGLAQAYEGDEKVEQAEAAYRRAVEARPGYWGGYNDLGRFYIKRGRFQEALESFRQVSALTPDSYRAYVNLGAAHFGLGQTSRAEEMFQESIRLKPNYGSYSNLGTLLFNRGELSKAAANFEKALEIDGRSYLLWGNLAACYRQMPGKQDRARAAFERAAEMAEKARSVNPGDALLLSDLAVYYAELGRVEQARALISRATELGPTVVDLQVNAATVYYLIQDSDLSIEWLARALDAGYPVHRIENSPAFSGLRQDQRYQELKERIVEGKPK